MGESLILSSTPGRCSGYSAACLCISVCKQESVWAEQNSVAQVLAAFGCNLHSSVVA